MGEDFKVKDSGERAEFPSGMQRDTVSGKTDYTLALDGPMFERYAVHLTKGAQKYEARNWMKASGQEELDRFKQSALRHFMQWFRGERDEDHAAAVWFNINGAEYVESQRIPGTALFLRPGRVIGVNGYDVCEGTVSEGGDPGVSVRPTLDAPAEGV